MESSSYNKGKCCFICRYLLYLNLFLSINTYDFDISEGLLLQSKCMYHVPLTHIIRSISYNILYEWTLCMTLGVHIDKTK